MTAGANRARRLQRLALMVRLAAVAGLFISATSVACSLTGIPEAGKGHADPIVSDAGIVQPGPNPQPGVSDAATSPPPPPPPPACGPTARSTANIPWAAPAPLHNPACSQQQIAFIAGWYSAPADDKNADAQFDQFQNDSANANCVQCALTSPPQPRGPLFTDIGNNILWNSTGCIALLSGDVSPTSCGARLEDRYQCEDDVCASCQSDQDVAACASAADRGICATVGAGDDCVPQNIKDACVGTTNETSQAYIARLVALFCGGA